jgi:hypothetical protein
MKSNYPKSLSFNPIEDYVADLPKVFINIAHSIPTAMQSNSQHKENHFFKKNTQTIFSLR